MDAERGRLKALLEKLRIEADILVFWLASGNLATYDTIVGGQQIDPDVDMLVNDCLQDEEWWDELQTLRGRPKFMSASQSLDSLANILESTAGRPGVFNPHNNEQGDFGDRRRHSTARLAELPKKPTVSTLARLGVNMGIHTANLLPTVFDSSSESRSGSSSETDSDGSSDDGNPDFNDDASAVSEADLEHLQPVRRPLLSVPGRRKSQNDAQIREPVVRRKNVQVERIARSPGPSGTRSYGTMFTVGADTSDEAETGGRGTSSSASYRPDLAAVSGALLEINRPVTPLRGHSRNASRDVLETVAPKPVRPSLVRNSSHASRFSSHLIPQTEITEPEGGSGPVLGFTEETDQQQVRRPGLSRTNSQARFSSRLEGTAEETSGPSVSFAPETDLDHHQNQRPHTMPPSPSAGPDVAINIAGLLAASHDQPTDEQRNTGAGSSGDHEDAAGALPLSFNDLPSRAQYLILNELWRQNSSSSAVLFTTLPIPAEGTCRSEEASVQYLSDIEVLCSDLPPVLLVLSNNMTWVLFFLRLFVVVGEFAPLNDRC